MSRYYQGFYRPYNPEKYKGNPRNIVFRSSWEKKAMRFFDLNSSIVSWGSEEIIIRYRSPADNRIHRYFPDFQIEVKTKTGTIETYLIEIKPFNQTLEPERKNKPKQRFIQEVLVYGINTAKWEAARAYCEKKGWKFLILTENELGLKGKKNATKKDTTKKGS